MKRTEKKENIVEFVGNLNRSNFLENAKIVVDSVNIIMAVSDFSIADLERLTKIHNITLRRILIYNRTGIFQTYNKLNNFVKKVIVAEEKNDKFFGFENSGIVETLILDDNFTGDIN